jgi:hypothetical protein
MRTPGAIQSITHFSMSGPAKFLIIFGQHRLSETFGVGHASREDDVLKGKADIRQQPHALTEKHPSASRRQSSNRRLFTNPSHPAGRSWFLQAVHGSKAPRHGDSRQDKPGTTGRIRQPPQTYAPTPNRNAVPACSPGVDAQRPRLGNQMHHRRQFPTADPIGVPSPTDRGGRMAQPAHRVGGVATSPKRVTFGTRTLPQNPVNRSS